MLIYLESILTFLEMTSSGNQEMQDGVKVLKRLEKLQQQPNPLLYYDLKKGVIFANEEKGKAAYWREVLKKLGEESDSFFTPVQFRKLLEEAVQYFSDKSEKCLREVTIDSHLQSFWKNIGEELLTWGCAFPPVRA